MIENGWLVFCWWTRGFSYKKRLTINQEGESKRLVSSLALGWVDNMCFTCFVFSLTLNMVWMVYMYMLCYKYWNQVWKHKRRGFLHDWWNVMKFKEVVKVTYSYYVIKALGVLRPASYF